MNRIACNVCSKYSAKTHRCSACKLASYCSKECQLKDWPKHRDVCFTSKEKRDDCKLLAGFLEKAYSDEIAAHVAAAYLAKCSYILHPTIENAKSIVAGQEITQENMGNIICDRFPEEMKMENADKYLSMFVQGGKYS